MLLFLALLFGLLAAAAFILDTVKGPINDKLVSAGLALFAFAFALYMAYLLHVQGKF